MPLSLPFPDTNIANWALFADSDSFPSARIPDWVADPTPNPVTFTPAAVAELTALVESGAMSMYTDPTQALAAAKEVHAEPAFSM